MLRKQILAAGVAALTVGAAVALGGGDVGQPPLAQYGPCFPGRTHQDVFELIAKGNCRCADGSCKEISCSAIVAGSVEDAKNGLRFELQLKAQAMGGRLVGEVSFEVRKR